MWTVGGSGGVVEATGCPKSSLIKVNFSVNYSSSVYCLISMRAMVFSALYGDIRGPMNSIHLGVNKC